MRRCLGRPTRPRAAVLLLCLLGASAAAHCADSPAGSASELQQLLQRLGQRTQAQARFEQSQYLAALKRPLQSSGTLSYRAPDHLEQHIEKPRPQLLVLDHGMLSLQLGRHRRSVALADYPQLAPLLDSLRALLAGDLATLQQRFDLQLQGPLSHWQLLLTPRAGALQQQLRDIRVRGEQAQILEVQLAQRDGDHSDMHIEPAP
ncbi:MAG TPA: outer membrane lipoprotein carrier protein LolA [Steroidobacteraceae bacterium]|nr:outer membrane lipoprotein carrier protein LolA [Steroidobacteraceae bacterium]